MGGEALFEDPTLPHLQGDLLGRGGNAIPQRLDVVDLLQDGEIVEPWRGHRQWASHGKTTLASVEVVAEG